MFLFVVNICLILNLFCIITVIFLERKNPITTLAWLMALIFLPGIGFILYFLFGRGLIDKRVNKLSQEEEEFIVNEATKQLTFYTTDKFDFNQENCKYRELIHMNLKNDHSIITDKNDVKIYNNGIDKFKDVFEDLKNAKRYIHILYFIIRNDKIANEMLDILSQKAKEGIEVIVIYDDFGSFFTNKKIFNKLKENGGKVYKFYPLLQTAAISNYRNHRKLIIIDGEIGYTGGINIGDEYLGKHSKLTPWRDTHIRIFGSSVQLLELRFILDYKVTQGKEINNVNDYFYTDKPFTGTTPIQIVSSDAQDTNENIKYAYIKMISEANKYIYIQTPYFIPDDSFMEALKISCYCGIDVRIMIPKIPDKKFVYGGTLSYIKDILQAGAKVYMYDGFLHSKAMVSDDDICTIGSANLDIRSFKLSFETNVFIYDENIAIEYRETFENDMKNCKEVTLESYKEMGLLSRAFRSFCRLFSPLM